MRRGRWCLVAWTVVALSVAGSGAAVAFECYVANRSAQGDAAAGSHSAAWTTLSVSDFAHGPGFPPGYDPDCFVEQWLAGGGPEAFTIRSNTVVGEGSSNPNLADGKGLEHVEEAYGALLAASLEACAL